MIKSMRTCNQYGLVLVRNLDWIGWRVLRSPELRLERRHRMIRQRTNVQIQFKLGNRE